MALDRRELLATGGIALMGTALLGGRFVNRCYARSQLQGEMMHKAAPLLLEKAEREIECLPALAREDIRTYFHGACLNVHGFVTEVCSHGFAERLRACAADVHKHQLLNVTFSQKVVTSTEVLNRVAVTAAEVGQELNTNWKTCCRKTADSWRTTLSAYPGGMQRFDISAVVDPLIQNGLDETRQMAYPLGQRPALSETAVDIGKSAILLLPVMAAQPWIGLPLFVVAALRPVWNWVIGRLTHRAGDYQMAISEHLAILGNR